MKERGHSALIYEKRKGQVALIVQKLRIKKSTRCSYEKVDEVGEDEVLY
jgi:hypothetical protein